MYFLILPHGITFRELLKNTINIMHNIYCFSGGPIEKIIARPWFKPLSLQHYDQFDYVCYSQKENNDNSSECSSRQCCWLKFLPKFISATLEENVNVSRLDGSEAPRLNIDEKFHIHPPSQKHPDFVTVTQTSAWPGLFVHWFSLFDMNIWISASVVFIYTTFIHSLLHPPHTHTLPSMLTQMHWSR